MTVTFTIVNHIN